MIKGPGMRNPYKRPLSHVLIVGVYGSLIYVRVVTIYFEYPLYWKTKWHGYEFERKYLEEVRGVNHAPGTRAPLIRIATEWPQNSGLKIGPTIGAKKHLNLRFTYA